MFRNTESGELRVFTEDPPGGWQLEPGLSPADFAVDGSGHLRRVVDPVAGPGADEASPESDRRRAHRTAEIVEVMTFFAIALGVIAGVVVAAQTDTQYDTYGPGDNQSFVLTGIAIAVGSIYHGMIVLMIARYVQSRTHPG